MSVLPYLFNFEIKRVVEARAGVLVVLMGQSGEGLHHDGKLVRLLGRHRGGEPSDAGLPRATLRVDLVRPYPCVYPLYHIWPNASIVQKKYPSS